MDEEKTDQSASATSKSEKGKSNALLIVLISVLVAAIAVLAVDRRARSASAAAHDVVAALVEADDTPTQQQVREALDREPHQVYRLPDGRVVEQYLWAGPVHEYSLYTYIQPGVDKMDFVTAVTLNTVREDVDLDAAELVSADVLDHDGGPGDASQKDQAGVDQDDSTENAETGGPSEDLNSQQAPAE